MPKVTLFKNIETTKEPYVLELLDYLDNIKNGTWQDTVLHCRNIKDKDERNYYKRSCMPTVSMSGEFSQRLDNCIIEHNGFISVDIDLEEDDNIDKTRLQLENDIYCYSVFSSVSGFGLRAMFKINGKKHRESFLGLQKYLFEKYSIIIDPNGINVSKPYIVSFDPYLYINEKSKVFTDTIKEFTEIKKIVFVHTPSDFKEVYDRIIAYKIDIAPSYSEWLKLCFAISDTFGADGESYFHELSKCNPKYNARACSKQYRACVKRNGSGVNISSFYHLAKSSGVKIVSESTREIIKATKNGKKAGLSKDKIVENLSKFQKIENAEKIVDKVYTDESFYYGEDEDGEMLEQLELYISSNYSLRMNEVTGYLEDNRKRLTQSDLNSLYINCKKLFPKLDYQLMMRLLKSDFIQSYNPFFEFFCSDGVPVILPPERQSNEGDKFKSPLIDELSKTIINDEPGFTNYFLKKWIVGIVSAAHKVHSPLVFCLLGEKHGTGKTEWFRRLLPVELIEYYAESKLDKEKDDEILMTESLIIMDDELGGKSKKDSIKFKNITSKQHFYLRRPYGDHNEKILRLAVLCGTSNILEIMSDHTGNRRTIPVKVSDIDKELYNKIDKKELFLEAYRLYKNGFDWRVNQDDMAYLNKNQEEYQVVSVEKELIDKYFRKPNDEKEKSLVTPLSTGEIIVELDKLSNIKFQPKPVGAALTSLSVEKKTVRDGASTIKKWIVIRKNRSSSNYLIPLSDDAPF